MLSCPPATTMAESPAPIAWPAMATARSPEPQTWLTVSAVLSCGMPAAIAAWRAGFIPASAVSTWPITASSTSAPSTPARSIAAAIATLPSSAAGSVASAPPNAPIGVRAAPAITMSDMAISFPIGGARPGLGPAVPRCNGKDAPPLMFHVKHRLRRCVKVVRQVVDGGFGGARRGRGGDGFASPGDGDRGGTTRGRWRVRYGRRRRRRRRAVRSASQQRCRPG